MVCVLRQVTVDLAHYLNYPKSLSFYLFSIGTYAVEQSIYLSRPMHPCLPVVQGLSAEIVRAIEQVAVSIRLTGSYRKQNRQEKQRRKHGEHWVDKVTYCKTGRRQEVSYFLKIKYFIRNT